MECSEMGGLTIKTHPFVFPSCDKFESTHSSPPSPPWSCCIPSSSCLDLLVYILYQKEQFSLEQMEAGWGVRSKSSAFRFLDAELRPLLSVIHLPGLEVKMLDETGKNSISLTKLENEIRFFDASGRSVLLLAKEEANGQALRVSCGELSLGLVEGFSDSRKLNKTVTGKNSKGHPIFQIVPNESEAVEEESYKILAQGVGQGKGQGQGQGQGQCQEIGIVYRRRGNHQFWHLKLSPHLNVRDKGLVLATVVSICVRYNGVTNRNQELHNNGLKSHRQQQNKRKKATIIFGVAFLVMFTILSIIVISFFYGLL